MTQSQKGNSNVRSARHETPTYMYVLYSLLILILGVIASPYLAYQAIRYKKYIGSLGQRMGYLPVSFNLDGEDSIWIHAVSVGETMTVRALIADLRRRYPPLRIFLSTTTMAGQQVARRNVQDVDAVFYLPLDLTFIVRRTLRLVKPRLFVMMETEIWPNLLRQCKRMGVATVMVNGRISSRSYPRYKLARPFFRRVLGDVDRFCMQTEESARRVIDIGADPANVVVTGSLKFDSLEMPGAATLDGRGQNRVLRYFRMTSGRPVIVAGSTMREEEQLVLQAFRRIKASAANPLLVHRAAPSRALRRSRAAGARPGVRHRQAIRSADRRRAAGRGRGARHDRRARAGLSDCDGRVRRRQPGRHRRAQHSGAGGVRQADRVRAAHAQLQGDRRSVHRAGRGRSGDERARSSKRRCWRC